MQKNYKTVCRNWTGGSGSP